MGIETRDYDLEPPLESRPFYTDKVHCEGWVARGLLILETETLNYSQEGERWLKMAQDALLYAKKLLENNEYPPQDEINAHFSVLVGEIQNEKEKWGELEKIIPEVWGFLAIEMAQENQD